MLTQQCFELFLPRPRRPKQGAGTLLVRLHPKKAQLLLNLRHLRLLCLQFLKVAACEMLLTHQPLAERLDLGVQLADLGFCRSHRLQLRLQLVSLALEVSLVRQDVEVQFAFPFQILGLLVSKEALVLFPHLFHLSVLSAADLPPQLGNLGVLRKQLLPFGGDLQLKLVLLLLHFVHLLEVAESQVLNLGLQNLDFLGGKHLVVAPLLGGRPLAESLLEGVNHCLVSFLESPLSLAGVGQLQSEVLDHLVQARLLFRVLCVLLPQGLLEGSPEFSWIFRLTLECLSASSRQRWTLCPWAWEPGCASAAPAHACGCLPKRQTWRPPLGKGLVRHEFGLLPRLVTRRTRS